MNFRYNIDEERRKIDVDRARRMNDAFKKSGPPEKPPAFHSDACRCGLCTGAKRPPLKSEESWGDGKPKIAGFRRLAVTPEVILEWLSGLGENWSDNEALTRDERLALADDLETAARVLRGAYA